MGGRMGYSMDGRTGGWMGEVSLHKSFPLHIYLVPMIKAALFLFICPLPQNEMSSHEMFIYFRYF